VPVAKARAYREKMVQRLCVGGKVGVAGGIVVVTIEQARLDDVVNAAARVRSRPFLVALRLQAQVLAVQEKMQQHVVGMDAAVGALLHIVGDVEIRARLSLLYRPYFQVVQHRIRTGSRYVAVSGAIKVGVEIARPGD
jgi:hypothetical protein